MPLQYRGSGFKPTVAGREAGVEPTGTYSRRVGVSLTRRDGIFVLNKGVRALFRGNGL